VVIGVLEVSFLNDLVMEHFLNQNLQVEPSILLGIQSESFLERETFETEVEGGQGYPGERFMAASPPLPLHCESNSSWCMASITRHKDGVLSLCGDLVGPKRRHVNAFPY
jgi:hypothetical protein